MVSIIDGDRNQYPADEIYAASELLAREFRNLGCKAKKVGTVLVVEAAGKICHLLETETSFTSAVAFRVLKDKRLAKRFFHGAGLNTAVAHSFRLGEKNAALQKLLEMGTAVVKPVDGNRGRGVSVNVGPEAFDAAWAAAAKVTTKRILLEEYFAGGQEARYLVVDGACVAVHQRIPPNVQGDGTSTIGRLIEQKNAIRAGNNPSRAKCPIKIDEHRQNILREQGLTLDSVPPPGQRVVIDWKAGISTGADAQDMTDDVHPTMKAVAERVAAVIPGLDVLGVDILARDHAQPAGSDNYIIVEANTRPMIIGHQLPDFGRAINVARIIAEHCLRQMRVTEREQRPPATAVATASRPSQPPPDQLVLVFGGDTSLGDAYLRKDTDRRQLDRLERDPDSFFAKLAPLLSGKTHFILNLETVLAEQPSGPLDATKGYLGWDSPDRTVATLKRIGVDAVSLANNHSMDYGPAGLRETLEHLRAAGIEVFGAGETATDARRPLTLSTPLGKVHVLAGFEFRPNYKNDFKFYATSAAPGVNPFALKDDNKLSQAIRKLREKDPAALIVAFPHWGGATNYQWASEKFYAVNSSFLAAGADLVLGHGAHMVQQLYADDLGTTAFSLGNLVFNSPGRYGKNDGVPYSLVCRLTLGAGGSGWTAGLKLYPIVSDNRRTKYRPRPVVESEARDLYAQLAARGQPDFRSRFELAQDDRGWHLLPTASLSSRVPGGRGTARRSQRNRRQ